uniref:Transthyretin-like family protein n=1 Tax=Panagrolaimus sp. JU765 TaxID=591449 RepID=A0AC34Q9G7_9BILA
MTKEATTNKAMSNFILESKTDQIVETKNDQSVFTLLDHWPDNSLYQVWKMRFIVGIALATIFCGFFVATDAMRKQGVAVKGKLVCGAQPVSANSTKVRIVDIDTGPDPDDTLDEKFVGNNGDFQLNGYTRELTNIDPVLYIWTDCLDADTPCQRKIKLIIPQKFIISGEPTAEQWVDFGVINLESTFAEEKRECIH